MAPDPYSLLAEPLRRCLWQLGWTELRPIQADAIEAILTGSSDIILSAPTAAGKTEAAFLPILSQLCERQSDSLGAMYVSPLKALINDQFRRLEVLCEHAGIPVHRWHGDVPANRKRKLLQQPGGVMLITPESVESLFVNHSNSLRRLMHDLQFVVIDEIHAFVGRERGLHLRSLLYRLQRYVEHPYRLVALSATLGDWKHLYAEWLRPDAPERVQILQDAGGGKAVRFLISAHKSGGKTADDQASDESGDETDQPSVSMIADIYQRFAGSTNLIFANKKEHVEYFADLLNEMCRRDGRPAEFLVHHASVSKEVREYTEEAMRGSRPCTTICSSTLELGIDIGYVTQIGQIDPPGSVASQVQRLGRSGRREGEPAIMTVYINLFDAPPGADLADRLYPRLLQAVAITELMIAKWIEPPSLGELDLSTLVQQILSMIAETGGMTAAELYAPLVNRGAFRGIPAAMFMQLLRCLGARDLLEQAPDGTLILGLRGEKIVRFYDFYSAFATPLEYEVRHDGRVIGTLPAKLTMFEPGDHFLLAGRRWEVMEVNAERLQITVRPASKRKPPKFGGDVVEIHTHVRQKMRDVLLSQEPIAYLNEQGREWLAAARAEARAAGLDQKAWVDQGPTQCTLFPWVGTRTLRTIRLLALHAGVQATELPKYQSPIALQFDAPRSRVVHKLRQALDNCPSPETLADRLPQKQIRKFDQHIDPELLVHSLATSVLDLPEAVDVLGRLLA